MPPTPPSPSHIAVECFIFGNSELGNVDADDSLADVSNETLDVDSAARPSRSMYVDIFEDMLETVVREEGALFNGPELDCFQKYSKLGYGASYLLVRLCLRKSGQWIRLTDLKYQRELGAEGVLNALRALCSKAHKPLFQGDIKPKIEEEEIVDLTTGRGVDEEYASEAEVEDTPPEPDYSFFARDESDASLEELLSCLRADELKDLAKQMRLKPKDSKRETLIYALLSTPSHQKTLAFDSPIKDKGKGVIKPPEQQTLQAWSPSKAPPPPRQSTLNYAAVAMTGTAIDILRDLVVKKLGACIQLNQDVVKLFNRVNLVYFRSVTLTPLLTPAILARSKKWSFAHHPRPQPPAAVSAPISMPPKSVLSPSSSQSSATSSAAELPLFQTPPTSQPVPTSQSSAPVAGPSNALEPGPSTLPYARTCYRLWPTRDDLLAYERALSLERRVDELCGNSGTFYPGARAAAASLHARATTSSVRAGSTVKTVSERAGSVASPWSVKSTPVLGMRGSASPWVEMWTSTQTPSTSRRIKRSVDDDDDEYADSEEDGDVLPVLVESQPDDAAEPVFAFLPELIETDEKIWRSGKGKSQKPPVENARIAGARQVVELGRKVFDMWCEIPEIRDALDKATAAAQTAGDILPDKVSYTHPKMEVEEELMGEMNGRAELDPDDQDVKEEHNSWETALRTRSQQIRLDEAARREAESRASQHIGGDQGPLWMTQFHHGYILTRILSKTAHALRTLHQQRTALHLYTHLLSQRVFRRGRRGGWHNERLLILGEYAPKCHATFGREWMCVQDALEDGDTHVVWRPKLERRREDIRKKLAKLGFDLGSAHEGNAFTKWPEVTIRGARIYPENEAASVGTSARPVKKRKIEIQDANQSTILSFVTITPTLQNDKVTIEVPKPLTGKSIWKGSNDEEIDVEIFALEHYQSKGYKGLHSEGRVLTTLFSLLFFDIIFTPIPGAFETPYQVSPLDIGSDTFYLARRELIDARLARIAAGDALEIGLATWDRESAGKTWCVGLRWDLLTREDWEEILAYWEPAALALVCRTLAEDFVNRTSGVPDLFLWHSEKKECKFVEVKGPGDHLQENQKLWMEVFVRANAKVEVCHVEDLDQAKTVTKFKRLAQSKTPAQSKAPAQFKTPAKSEHNTHTKKLLLKPKPVSPTKRNREVIVVESDSDSESVSHGINYSQLDPAAKLEPTVKPKGAELKQEPTPRRSARAKAETKYRFDVEAAAVALLEEQGALPISPSKKRKRMNGPS
ncbi:hypothetical protein PHLGIDRAFT_128521 [Phlebiopsis gigantea 11061_1 CR5-6]|uniref:Fanconi-associated nuclease n=1 Tax=Phlebiopsis gigantea (strain 11061_1 CR5-6) TaxID=745531 RepID=A0A0C3PJ08_PHLG1|nr:hypothetical protein PHLGIDRAFT_128521 [Phlebiopsis gigantea 11061_1 CR5-6]